MWKISKVLAIPIAMLLMRADADSAAKGNKSQPEVAEITGQGRPTLWREPVDIASRDLIYGSGGQERMPRGPFTFVKEDLNGSNPKFDVRASDGVKWKIKLGIEARPETAATRLVWAVGYFVTDDYYMPELRVEAMPARLERGRKYVTPDGVAYGARLKRDPEHATKKIGIWEWMNCPFLGTSGFSWTKAGSRGNLRGYRHSKFIRQLTPDYVDFNVPSRPALDHFPAIHELKVRLRMRAIGWRIPRQDARWMGQMLGQLSPQQIRDAFRAAGYGPEDVEGFSQVVESRIGVLKSL
jgi:hypothetical protein